MTRHPTSNSRHGQPRSDPCKAWTADRIQALGVTTDLATAASIFQLSRSVAYDLARRNQFPIAVLRFGTRYKVPVAAILHALQLRPRPADSTAPQPPAT